MSERGNNLYRLLDRYAGIPIAFALAPLRYKKKRPAANPSKFGILCPGAIGDLLLVSALANGLRCRFPHAGVEILASSANAQALPLVCGKGISGLAFKMSRPDLFIRHARRAHYDILFDTSQWARIGAIISSLSGSGLIVGFSTRGQFRASGYDLKVIHGSHCHELDNFLALGRAVWPDFHGWPKLAEPDMPAPLKAECGAEKIICCHMWPARGRGRIFKQWPEEYWSSLIEELLSYGFRVYLTGGQADAAENASFMRKFFAGKNSVSSLAGRASLLDTAALLARSAAVVSVNTGIMHLAALLGVPTAGLHGATNPLRWGPVGPKTVSLLPRSGQRAYLDLGFEYLEGAAPSMRFLPVCDVISALRQLGVLCGAIP